MIPRIIGLTGYAGVGKDLVANYLHDKYQYRRLGVSDPIKELLNKRFGWDQEWWFDRDWKENSCGDLGYFCDGDGTETNFSPRSWVQWLGTEVGRALDEDIWIRMSSRKITNADDRIRWCVADIRFPNEGSYLKERWGASFKCIRILRPGGPHIMNHSSELSVDSVKHDALLMNDGTPAELYEKVERQLRFWDGQR